MTVTQMFPKASVFGGYGRADFDVAMGSLRYFDSEGNVLRASMDIIYLTVPGQELGIHG